jgi:hypothetical protein
MTLRPLWTGGNRANRETEERQYELRSDQANHSATTTTIHPFFAIFANFCSNTSLLEQKAAKIAKELMAEKPPRGCLCCILFFENVVGGTTGAPASE